MRLTPPNGTATAPGAPDVAHGTAPEPGTEPGTAVPVAREGARHVADSPRLMAAPGAKGAASVGARPGPVLAYATTHVSPPGAVTAPGASPGRRADVWEGSAEMRGAGDSPAAAPLTAVGVPEPAGAAPTAGAVLARCRTLVAPALAFAVRSLHPWVADMGAYALGLPRIEDGPARAGAGDHAIPGAGKGVRQALAVLAAEAVGGGAGAGVPAAVAVELVHVFSLVHDDVMDGDDLRRGRPALWRAYGTGPAVLAGDALLTLAVGELAPTPGAVRRLTAALGDLVHGQADDLLFAGRPWTGPDAVGMAEYEAMAERKTGALLGCALALGARLGGAPEATVEALDRAGRHLGVGFQAADDLLGIWGDPDVTGKPVHGDLRQRKKTLPVLAALATAHGPALAAALEAGRTQEAAELVTAAGGRATTLREGRHHLARARALLAAAPLRPGPAAALTRLLEGLEERTV